MAESLAVVSIVASILQLVEFSTKVLSRLNDFQSRSEEIPKCFRHLKVELPLLVETLKQIESQISTGSIDTEVQRSLKPVVDACNSRLQSLEELVDKSLPLPTDSQSQKAKKALSSLTHDSKVEKIRSELQAYVQTLTFYFSVAVLKLRTTEDENFSKIHRWLSPPDPSFNYHKALKLRLDDTGTWFTQSTKYTEWKTAPASFLWLCGKPGCGKTILSASIVDDLLLHCADDPGKVTAYFYFDFNDTQKQMPLLMLKSLITQLLSQHFKMPAALEVLFSLCNNGSRQPHIDELLRTLQQLIPEFPQSFIILDALDESKDRDELMDIITTITNWKIQNTHVIVTSRKEPDIETFLEDFVQSGHYVSLENKTVDEDIQKYVRKRLADDKELKRWSSDPEMQLQIEKTLMEKSNGMFRWAVCQLDALRKCLNRKMLRKSLEELPRTLDETYNRILCSIDGDYQQHALKILQWLAFSVRPLSVRALAEVIAIDPEEDPPYDNELLLPYPMDILKICPSLIILENQNNELASEECAVKLAHYSVKEYLISKRIREGSAKMFGLSNEDSNRYVAECCICYLLQFQDPDTDSEEIFHHYKLAYYAAQYWTEHALMAGEYSESMMARIMELYNPEERPYRFWNTLVYQDGERAVGWTVRATLPSPLYAASLAGLYQIVKHMLAQGYDNINNREGWLGTVLVAAALGGDKRIVEMLLDCGADVNATGHDGTALIVASERGYYPIVQLLISRGANLNAINLRYSTALSVAAMGGHKTTVDLLLVHGADVNCGDIVVRAAESGHKELLERLLDEGADINSSDVYENAITRALLNRKDGVVELLLERGVDINAPTQNYSNALAAAIHDLTTPQTVEMLLSHGAEINAVGNWSPLVAAVSFGRESLVQLLLVHGADTNLVVGSHYAQMISPLIQASECGQGIEKELIVELLLAHGADIDEPVGPQSALTAAAATGNQKVVQLLLDHGAFVNLRGGELDTALTEAAYSGNEELVKLLLSYGADSADEAGRWGSALAAASANNNAHIVQLLLDRGDDVNIKGREGFPLLLAARNGNTEIVQMLLNHGANVNLSHGNIDDFLANRTALEAASKEGNKGIVELLVNHGANINTLSGGYSQALIIASYKGYKDIAEFLLRRGALINGLNNHEVSTAISAASLAGQTKLVEILLQNGADIHSEGQYKGIALAAACSFGSVDIVEMLLDAGADVNAPAGHHVSALVAACFRGSAKIVNLLLGRGASDSVSGQQHVSASALPGASIRGYETVVNILLDNGTDINSQSDRWGTAVTAASSSGYERIVRILTARGADIHRQSKTYGSALTLASRNGHERIVDFLISQGADVNVQGGEYDSALIAASGEGHIRIVRKLLAHGADVNGLGENYGSAIVAASLGARDKIIQLLLDHGAKINLHGQGLYGSALAAASYGGFQRVVELLLRNGANVNEQGGEHGNALAAAAFIGQERITEILLKHGADVNQLGGAYGSALAAASGSGYERVVRLLLKNGADINAMVGGYWGTALQGASFRGLRRVVRLLLEHGADVNALGGEFGSPLAAASFQGWELIVELLVENGANINAELQGRYKNASEAALAGNRKRVVALLQKRRAE